MALDNLDHSEYDDFERFYDKHQRKLEDELKEFNSLISSFHKHKNL